MNFWYKTFSYLFYPFAPIYLYFRKIKKKEDLIRYKEKLAKINIQSDDGFLIWIHMASVGEAMSILPLVQKFIEEKKIKKILLTSITLSSGKILEKKFQENEKVIHQFLPLDIPILVNKFLNHWKPNLAIFVDSEIWPNLIFEIKKKDVPLVLLNARITEKTFKKWKIFKNFSKKIFEKFDLCLASNKESENFLKILGAKNIKNFGNLKFSSIKNNSNKTLDPLFLNKIKDRKIWCAASTHNPEELLCAKTHIGIKKYYNNILTIIIPRHVDRIEEIKKEISKIKLNVVLSSELSSVNKETDIILIDSYGETLKFYNISKHVFLGKSLVSSLALNSGQNPIEPARQGCKIFHGPNISNFKEIYEYFKKLNITKEVHNANSLCLSLVEEFKEDKVVNSEIVEKIENYGQNIFNSVIIELKKYIK